MLRKILSLIITIVFAVTGLILADYFLPYISEFLGYNLHSYGFFLMALVNGVGLLLFSWLGLVTAPLIVNVIMTYSERLAVVLSRIPTSDILVMIFGIGIGLALANLIGGPFSHLPIVGPYIPMVFSLVLGVVGAKVSMRKHNDIVGLFNRIPSIRGNKNAAGEARRGDRLYSSNKLLDTSVIIDGRIADIMQTGFIDGFLLVPGFVLEELQKLADSSDGLKRAKGRRGLDLVQDLRQRYGERVLVEETDYEDLDEVDAKLLRLAKQADAAILTNDFNLNKVAEIQDVKVLNINDLANAIKPIVIAGEELSVYLVKEGREYNQGLAYLDDGTMIVVENGRRLIGSSAAVIVSSVLQTSAGRMIFAKLKE